MSKTPRVDKFLRKTQPLPSGEFGENARVFMRELEAELVEARAEIERKDKLVEQMREALAKVSYYTAQDYYREEQQHVKCAYKIAVSALSAAERIEI